MSAVQADSGGKIPRCFFVRNRHGILALDVAVRDSGSNMFVENYFEEETADKRVHIMNMLTTENYVCSVFSFKTDGATME